MKPSPGWEALPELTRHSAPHQATDEPVQLHDERGTANTPPGSRTHPRTYPPPGTAHPGPPAPHPHGSRHVSTGAGGSTPRRGRPSRQQAPPLGERAPGHRPPAQPAPLPAGRKASSALLLSPVTCGRRPSRPRREEPRGCCARTKRGGRPEQAVGGAGARTLHRHEGRDWRVRTDGGARRASGSERRGQAPSPRSAVPAPLSPQRPPERARPPRSGPGRAPPAPVTWPLP